MHCPISSQTSTDGWYQAHLEEPADTCHCEGITHTDDGLWVCGDKRLGPKTLPSPGPGPISKLLLDYNRFAGVCPSVFLTNWFDLAKSDFKYPEHYGFQLTTAGVPILGEITLSPGTRVDRFGGENGLYLSPLGTLYARRAIPPRNLNGRGDAAHEFNYYAYEVIRPFSVWAGPTAAWFGQPGLGTQYLLALSVGHLVGLGYLNPLIMIE